MTDPIVCVVNRYRRYSDDEDHDRWFPNEEEARTYAETLVDINHGAQITKLLPGGEVDWYHVTWTPEPYSGPLKRAFISVPLNDKAGHGCVHREGVDCVYPTRFNDQADPPEVNEEHPYWIVRTEHGATWEEVHGKFKGPDLWVCRCGTWQEIEGTPEKVDELSEKYPLAVTL